jgi:hypothetical protein
VLARASQQCLSDFAGEISLLDDAEARTQRAVQAVLAYLALWPHAADTEQGIAQWWLPSMNADVPRENLHEALERLLRAQAMERTPLPDGSFIYRAASGSRGP